MPAAEGTFPKAGGDPLYASEVNRFAAAGRLIQIGSTLSVGASGTAFINVGSFVINNGSLTNPCQVFWHAGNSANNATSQIIFSGTSNNLNFQYGVNDTTVDQAFGFFTAGSLFSGAGFLFNPARSTFSTVNSDNFDVGSTVWVLFRMRSSDAVTKRIYYGIQSFRSTISGT